MFTLTETQTSPHAQHSCTIYFEHLCAFKWDTFWSCAVGLELVLVVEVTNVCCGTWCFSSGVCRLVLLPPRGHRPPARLPQRALQPRATPAPLPHLWPVCVSCTDTRKSILFISYKCISLFLSLFYIYFYIYRESENCLDVYIIYNTYTVWISIHSHSHSPSL